MFKPGIKIVTTEADNVKKIKECYSSQNYQLLEFWDHLLFYSTCSNCLFLFKDLNASGRRTSLNDSGYHIAFGTKVPGAPTSGKNKVRLEKKTHYHLMLGCHFLYIEKNYCQVYCQFALSAIDLSIKCNDFHNDKIQLKPVLFMFC